MGAVAPVAMAKVTPLFRAICAPCAHCCAVLLLLLLLQKGKGKGKGKGKKGKGKKAAGKRKFFLSTVVSRGRLSRVVRVRAAADDLDPLSPEFQLIKAKSQIESLEHQLSTQASPSLVRDQSPRVLIGLCSLRARSAAHGCRYTRHPGAGRGD